RRRALEGLELAGGDPEKAVAGLQPRQFLMAGARIGTPVVMGSRWAMSYLRGPLTLAELRPLLAGLGAPAAVAAPAPAAAVALDLPDVEELYAAGARLAPAVLLEGRAVYRKAAPVVQREVVASWVAPLSPQRVVWEKLQSVELPPLDGRPPAGSTLGALPANASTLLKGAAKDLVRELVSRPVEVLYHRAFKLVQDEHEDEEMFRARCLESARATLAAKTEQLRDRVEAKLRGIDDKLVREQMELTRDQQDLATREHQQQLALASGVGGALLKGLGALLGGRRSGLGSVARSGVSAARQVSEKGRMTDRAKAEVAESEQQITSLQAERQRLLDELQREVDDLQGEADRLAGGFERLPLTPAARDITVRRVALLWLPEDQLA
ncbi:MAG TPA: hypothetical protein PLS53_06590, partial [Thermoanaerobaculaceae bacterium]|nr:hypothetical protein [Thermoanaerobaculaceae bacterium]